MCGGIEFAQELVQLSDLLQVDVAETFRFEAEETLSQLEASLLELDSGEANGETLNAIFRAAHNLKGAAMVVGRRDVGELAHVLEELLTRWRDGRLMPARSQLRWALEAVGVLREQLHVGDGTRDEEAAGGSANHARERQLRVALPDIDTVLDLVCEMVIASGRLAASLDQLPPALRDRASEAHDHLRSLQVDLRDQVMRWRMVPTAPLLARLRHTVQDVARKLDKQAQLVVEGGDAQLDTTLIDGLRDPFIHMVRNAVDHGLETAEARLAAGKPAEGRVTLSIRKTGGAAVFVLADDGKGLDRDRIAHKVRERGRDMQAATLSDADLAAFIFEPGFSTAEKVTEVSGRGVGMDVVRKNIQDLRGSIEVSSQAGRGTTFTITVPLSLSILDGLHVEAATQSFVVPQERVLECVDSGAAERPSFSTLRLRERSIPCVRLAAFLGANAACGRETVLVLSHASGPVGLVVDRSLGEQQTVLKPVGPLFRSLPMIAGATILGNGEVALVLDVDRLVEISTRRWQSAT